MLFLNIKNSNAQFECELINNNYFGQEERELSSCSDLINYKLDKTNNYNNSPVYVVNAQFHIIQFSASDPRNFTTADLPTLYQMQNWINDMFISLNSPTIPVLNPTIEEVTTRIKFNFYEPDFIIDPSLWDYSPYTYPAPISIIQYNSNTSPLGDEIIVSGNVSLSTGRFRIENSDQNDGCYIFVSSIYESNTNTTKLRLPNNQHFNNITPSNNGVLYFVPNPATSYSNAPYTTYHSQIKDRLHIYLVSFSDPCRNDFGFAPGIGFPACYNAFKQPMNPLSYYAAA